MSEGKYEELYKSLFENNRDAVIFFNETTIVNANQSALDLFEVGREEFIGHELYEFTLDKEEIIERAKRRLQGVSESFTTKIDTPEGVKLLEVSATSVNIENITSYCIVRDITQRKRLEQRFRVIFEHSRDMISVASNFGVEFINPSGVEYLGYSNPDEIVGIDNTEFIHPDYRELVTKYGRERRAGGTPPNQYRAKMITKDGISKPVEFNVSYIEWDGKPASLSIARDISKQVNLEEELRQSQETLNDFIESSTDELIILNEDMRFIMVNEAVLKNTGLTREDYIGKHILEVFPDLEGSERYAGYLRVLETGESTQFHDITSRFDKRRFNYTAFKAGDYLGIIGRDVTTEKEFERQMLEYQRKLEIFYKYSTRLEEAESIKDIYRIIYEAIREAIAADYWEVKEVLDDQVVVVFPENDSSSMSLDEPSITSRTIKEKEIQLVKDTSKDPDFDFNSDTQEIRSCIMVPISYGEKVIGLINVESSQVDAFNDSDREMLEIFASGVSIAISNINYKNNLVALHDFSIELTKYDSLDDIAEETLRTVDNVLDFPFSSFGVIRDNALWFPYVHGGEPNTNFYLPLDGPGVTVRAVRTGETQVVNDVTFDPDYVDPDIELDLGKSELVVPLFEEGKPVGVITVETPDIEEFSDDSVNLLELLGDIVSARLTSIRVEEERIRAEEAEEMEAIKSRFMRTATHELRTPLTSMKGFLELAMSETDLESIQNYLEVAYRNTDRLEALTNDLLDQQRLEDERMNLDFEVIDFSNLVSQVVNEFSPVIREKNQVIEVNIPDNLAVKGDRIRLEQVLVNLLDNASKYSPEDSRIELVIEDTSNLVKVSVIDEGFGLREDEIGKLFKPFPDIERPTVTDQSIGLGLSICKGIIDLHGGEIWAESPGCGQGSTFIFTIPMGEVEDE